MISERDILQGFKEIVEMRELGGHGKLQQNEFATFWGELCVAKPT